MVLRCVAFSIQKMEMNDDGDDGYESDDSVHSVEFESWTLEDEELYMNCLEKQLEAVIEREQGDKDYQALLEKLKSNVCLFFPQHIT